MIEFLYRYKKTLISCVFLLLIFFIFPIDIVLFYIFPLIVLVVPVYLYVSLLLISHNLDKKSEHPLDGISRRFVNSQIIYILGKYIAQDDQQTNTLLKEIFITKFGKFRYFFFEKREKKSPLWAIKKLNKKLEIKEKITLLFFFIKLATTDKYMSVIELNKLDFLRKKMGFHSKTFQSFLAQYNYTDEQDINQQKQVKQYTSTSISRYYKIMELTESATEQEIKEAYRRLVKIYHPDSAKKVTSFSKQQFQFVQEAYDKIKEHKGLK